MSSNIKLTFRVCLATRHQFSQALDGPLAISSPKNFNYSSRRLQDRQKVSTSFTFSWQDLGWLRVGITNFWSSENDFSHAQKFHGQSRFSVSDEIEFVGIAFGVNFNEIVNWSGPVEQKYFGGENLSFVGKKLKI